MLIFLLALLALPDDDTHPVVPGFERFEAVEDVGDVERGMLLINELNCLSCHQSEDFPWAVAPKQAPILTEVGSRITPEYFQAFLLDPHTVKPGTTMPDVFAGRAEADKQMISLAIAHFLASTGTVNKQSTNASFVVEGEKLFHTIGCVACHDPQNSDTTIGTSIPLGQLETKYRLPSLTQFILDPLHVRPSGRMPQFDLTATEAQKIAAYLLRDLVVDSKVHFSYYEGDWSNLPDFKTLQPISSGIAAGFEMGVGRKQEGFGIVFSGFWTTKQDAEYRFRLTSDDGSRLIIDGKMIVENDGIHAMTTVEKTATLPAGVHEIRLEFFEAAGGEGLSIEVFGGGLEGVSLDSLLRATPNETTKAKPDFEFDSGLAIIGQAFFQNVGCADCHELKIDHQLVESTQPTLAKPLVELKAFGGCLPEDPDATVAGSPSFGLSKSQTGSILSALRLLSGAEPAVANNDPMNSLDQSIHQRLLTLNCYACHSREQADGLIRGGVVDVRGESDEIFGRKDWFTGTEIEMGDEGQHPPVLKSVGAKLKPEWLDRVLQQSTHDRPYVLTRMPKFGTDNLGNLAQDLIQADRLEDIASITQTETVREVKAHGRFLAGEDALSCIKCHNFGKHQSTGIQAMDLATMTSRLNQDWFQAYMLKPSRFRRGTRMPESWPGGKSFYPDMLDGKSDKQIDALWEFLSDGTAAAKPKGLIRTKLELKPTTTPIMYRNFIEGAGPRAIGVGYPEQVNIAFDAQLCRLALIWQENFIDASRHWTARGEGFEPPLGENILELPASVAWTTDLKSIPWLTELKNKNRPAFKGYRFDDQRRPIFQYQLGDITIEDQPIPNVVDGRPLLNRIFKIESSESDVIYYRAAAGSLIKLIGQTATIDDRLKITFEGPVKPFVRITKSGSSLMVKIDLSDGSAEFKQTYDW